MNIRVVRVVAALFGAYAAAWDVAKTPPLGFNTWNFIGCRVTGQDLMDTVSELHSIMAQAMHDRGLAAAGYTFVNSDDCWMLRNRSASGDLVPDPARFPNGWLPITKFIHGLGMKSGLYTSKSEYTCAGFAASCGNEMRDAALFASWEIDYVKEDSCGGCRGNDTEDYFQMHEAILASGRPMIQTDEGAPDNHNCSVTNMCGNAKRVGHDIQPSFTNMISLVDIDSGLWPFAHNSTGDGGWWNDADMLEVGNGDFSCDDDAAAMARCHVHFSMWAILKAPLLIGTNVTAMTPGTLSVYLNSDALAINQDSLGIQAKRVAFASPSNSSLSLPWDSQVVVATCDASRPTQAWTWTNRTPPSGAATSLYEVKCDATDATQSWSFAADGTLRNRASGLCVDAPLSGCTTSPAQLAPCDATRPQQQWQLLTGGQIMQRGSPANCLDIPYGVGPDVAYCSCHPPGTATNQEWTLGADGRLSSVALAGTCLAPLPGEPGGSLQTTDAYGNDFCLNFGAEEGSWHGVPCASDDVILLSPVPISGTMPPVGVRGNFTFSAPTHDTPGWADAPGTSGPWPNTQYVTGSGRAWSLALGVPGAVVALDEGSIYQNDFVNPPTQGTGGPFCLDLVANGGLETWAAPLTGGRVAVALLNRSPGPDSITVQWADIGLAAGTIAHVSDAWTGDLGVHMDSFSMTVASKDVALLTLTPQS